MSNVILTLGGIAFRDFEVPEQITFGGTQALAVHQVIGGGHVVDALGAADAEIQLAGVFSGPDAVVRVQALDVARSLGGTLPLIWKGFFYSVIIAELAAAYTKSWWIPFRLRLVVVQDLATAVPSLLEQATLDLATAQTYTPQTGFSFQNISVSSLSSINTGLATVSSMLSAEDASFTQNTEALNGATDTTTAISAIQDMMNSGGTLPGLANVKGYLGRAAVNLSGLTA